MEMVLGESQGCWPTALPTSTDPDALCLPFLGSSCPQPVKKNQDLMGNCPAHLGQVSVREAIQVLLEATDVNCVLVPAGAKVRSQHGKEDPKLCALGCSCASVLWGLVGR